MQITDRKKKVRETVSREYPSLRIEISDALKKANELAESTGLKKEVYDPSLKTDLSTAERLIPDVGEVAKGVGRGAIAQPLTGIGGSTQMVGDVATTLAEKISKANRPGTVKDFVALQVEEFAKRNAQNLARAGQFIGDVGDYANKVFQANPRYSQGTMFTNPSVTKAASITAEATPQIALGMTPGVGPALSGGYGLVSETGSTYRDLSAQSPEMSVLEKMKRSVGSGVAVGAMDALGAKLMPRSMMAEPITEALQQIPSNLATGRPVAEGMVDSAVGGYGGASVSHSVANVPQNVDLVKEKVGEFISKLPPPGMAPAFATATPSRRYPATETLGNARQIYIGERAQGWDKIPAEDKFIAPDAKPRAEITDHESKLKFKDAMDAYSKKYAASEVIYNSVRAKEGQWYGSEEHRKISKARDSLRKKIQGSATLKDILDHPELYKQYPFAKDIPVVFKKMSENTAGALVDPESEIMHPEHGMHIAIPLKALDDLTSKNPHIKEFKQTLLHEVNHAIQYYEGHGGGGSSSKHGWSTYLKLLGEVESRDTEFRIDMTPEERKANPPYMSQVNTSLRPGEVDDNRRISSLSDIIPNVTTPVEYKPVVVSNDTRQQLDQIRQNFAVYKRYGGKTPKKFYNLALVNTELDLNKSEIRSLMYESFDSKEAAMAALKRLNQMDIEKKTAQYARDNYLDSWAEEKVKPVVVEETTSATDDGMNWKINKDYKVVATQEDAFNFDDSKVMEELERRLQGQKKSRKKMIAESVASETKPSKPEKSKVEQPIVIVSPNTEESPSREMTPEEVVKLKKKFGSSDHARFKSVLRDILIDVGLPAEVISAIGMWTDGGEDAVVVPLPEGTSPEVLKYIASMAAKQNPQKAYLHFTPGKGDHFMVKMTIPLNYADASSILSRESLPGFSAIQRGNMTEVLVFDKDGTFEHLEKFAKKTGASITWTRGTGGFVGGETRASAVQQYKKDQTESGLAIKEIVSKEKENVLRRKKKALAELNARRAGVEKTSVPKKVARGTKPSGVPVEPSVIIPGVSEGKKRVRVFEAARKIAKALDIRYIGNNATFEERVKRYKDGVKLLYKLSKEGGRLEKQREFYSKAPEKVEARLSTHIPELKEKGKSNVLRAVVAITSNGEAVSNNFGFALEEFTHYLNTGDFKYRESQRADAVSKALKTLKTLIDEHGEDGLKDYLTKYEPTLTEKGNVSKAEPDAPVAVRHFNDKIGRFMSNLYGVGKEATIDMWQTRLYHILMGDIKSFYEVGVKRNKKGDFEATKAFGKVVESPASMEKRVMRKALEEIASEMGETTADMQSISWHEIKSMYSKMTGEPIESIDYADAVTQELDNGLDIVKENGKYRLKYPESKDKVRVQKVSIDKS